MVFIQKKGKSLFFHQEIEKITCCWVVSRAFHEGILRDTNSQSSPSGRAAMGNVSYFL